MFWVFFVLFCFLFFFCSPKQKTTDKCFHFHVICINPFAWVLSLPFNVCEGNHCIDIHVWQKQQNASTGSVTSLHPINWFAGALKTFTEEARPVVGKGGKLLHWEPSFAVTIHSRSTWLTLGWNWWHQLPVFNCKKNPKIYRFSLDQMGWRGRDRDTAESLQDKNRVLMFIVIV